MLNLVYLLLHVAICNVFFIQFSNLLSFVSFSTFFFLLSHESLNGRLALLFIVNSTMTTWDLTTDGHKANNKVQKWLHNSESFDAILLLCYYRTELIARLYTTLKYSQDDDNALSIIQCLLIIFKKLLWIHKNIFQVFLCIIYSCCCLLHII